MDELILLGKKIAEIRVKKGLTQEKLSEMINYSANHIAKLESARTNPSFELLVKVAKAMKINTKDLFDFDDLNTPEFMRQDLLNTIENADSELIRLLYKFKQSLSI